MIVVKDAPIVKRSGEGRWEFVLWVGAAGDYTTPFRKMLGEMVGILKSTSETSLHLPTHDENEDFVEGHISFGESRVDVYFECSLSYVALSAEHRQVLDEIASISHPNIKVIGW